MYRQSHIGFNCSAEISRNFPEIECFANWDSAKGIVLTVYEILARDDYFQIVLHDDRHVCSILAVRLGSVTTRLSAFPFSIRVPIRA